MGIEGLHDFIKKYAPSSIVDLPVSKLKGKKVAIDANNWVYSNASVIRRRIVDNMNVVQDKDETSGEMMKELLRTSINFGVRWLKEGIIPVFVFDGTPVPEKGPVREKRIKEKQKREKKIEELRKQIDACDPLLISESLIENLRKELRNSINFTRKDLIFFEDQLSSIGFPTVKADDDGERGCTSLFKKGEVDAVLSTDGDCLAYGCRFLITKLKWNFKTDNQDTKGTFDLHCILLDPLLSELGLSFEQFKDLCIMSGCDFNINVKGFGIAKSYKLLKKYGNIESIPPEVYRSDISCLNYKKCRSLFEDENVKIENKLVMNSEVMPFIRDRLSPFDLDYLVPVLIEHVQ